MAPQTLDKRQKQGTRNINEKEVNDKKTKGKYCKT